MQASDVAQTKVLHAIPRINIHDSQHQKDFNVLTNSAQMVVSMMSDLLNLTLIS